MKIETEPTQRTTSAEVKGEPRSALLRAALAAGRNYGTVLILLLLVVVFSLSSDAFLTLRNVQSVLIVQAITALMTFGVMFPLIVGEFDLSVGYMIGFLAMLGAFLAGHGSGALVVIPVMILTGGVIGLCNGLLL